MTVALDGLIRSQYPKDSLRIVGFSSYARQIKKEDLSYMSWDEFDPYTNMQHGFYVARKLLAQPSYPPINAKRSAALYPEGHSDKYLHAR